MKQANESLRLSQRAIRAAEAPISYLMHAALVNPDLISLAVGFVDQESLPVEAVRQTVDELSSNPLAARQALQYGTTQGYLRLRELAVEQFAELEGRSAAELNLSAADVVITTGSQQLLQLVSEVLIDPGDIVLMGAPDYFVYMSVLSALGGRAIGVGMDDRGMVPASLDETLDSLQRAGELHRVKLIYCTSYYQNPTGVTLSGDRRPEILEIVRKWSGGHRIYLIEDAAYRDLYYTAKGPPSLRSWDTANETVILTQTFSKSFSPGFKVAATFLPRPLVAPLLHQKGNQDFGSANFNQHLLAEIIASGRFAQHGNHLRALYGEKASAVERAMQSEFAGIPARWTQPSGGLYVWVILPSELDTARGGALFQQCIERGVLYVPGEYCFPPELPRGDSMPLGGPSHTLRLCFGVPSLAAIQEGIHRLAGAVRVCLP